MGAGNGKGAVMEDGYEWYREQGVEQVMGKQQGWKMDGSGIGSREWSKDGSR